MIASAWKACEGQPSVGSNPTSSAEFSLVLGLTSTCSAGRITPTASQFGARDRPGLCVRADRSDDDRAVACVVTRDLDLLRPGADGGTGDVRVGVRKYFGAVGSRRDLVERHRAAITELARAHRGQSVALFGSAARGEDLPGSDIDLLVEFEPGSSLFDLLHLQDDLEALLGCRVDVVSTGGLKARDDDLLREAVPL